MIMICVNFGEKKFIGSLFFFFFFLCHRACGNLVLQTGIEPKPPTLEALSVNHQGSSQQ